MIEQLSRRAYDGATVDGAKKRGRLNIPALLFSALKKGGQFLFQILPRIAPTIFCTGMGCFLAPTTVLSSWKAVRNDMS